MVHAPSLAFRIKYVSGFRHLFSIGFSELGQACKGALTVASLIFWECRDRSLLFALLVVVKGKNGFALNFTGYWMWDENWTELMRRL